MIAARSGGGWRQLALLAAAGVWALWGAGSARAELRADDVSLRLTSGDSGAVVLEWTSDIYPAAMTGWHVERREPDGAVTRLTADPVAVELFAAPGHMYVFADEGAGARAGEIRTYRLVAVDAEWREWPGSFRELVVEAPGPDAPEEAPVRRERAGVQRRSLPVEPGNRVRMTVTNDGVYRVSAAEIAGLLIGQSEADIEAAISSRGLRLTRDGHEVAWTGEADGSALRFVGEKYADSYGHENIYWLEPGPGPAMAEADRRTDDAAPDGWFWETLRFEQQNHYQPQLPGEVDDDYFVWDGKSLTSPNSTATITNRLNLLDPYAPVKTGMVSALLIGAYDGPPEFDNHTRLRVVGETLADRRWSGDERIVLAGPTTRLGGETLTVYLDILRQTGVVTTTVMLDALKVTYARQLRARNNRLLFTVPAETGVLTVCGFTNPEIRVFAVDNPRAPVEVQGTVAADGAEWQVSWAAEGAGGRYLVSAADLTPAHMTGAAGTVWRQPQAGAEYVVITSHALAGAAQALVDYRQQTGMNAVLAQVEDLFNEFFHGRRDPGAVREFLKYAEANWAEKPAYVCLAGDGHLDYHDVFNQSASRPNHIPPVKSRVPIDATPSGNNLTVGADNPMADWRGNSRPEVAIGRLPAQTPAALTRMIERIIQHESGNAWKNRALLVSDKDVDEAFSDARNRLARKFPPGIAAIKLGRAMNTPAAEMRTNFVKQFNAGPLLAVYYGHANNIGISSPYFLEHSHQRSHMNLLTNRTQTPLFVAGTCMLNNFAEPHPQSRCLGKGFLDTAPGGPVAVWSSATENTLSMAEATASVIVTNLFGADESFLGDIVQKALDLQARSASPWVTGASVLLGDPALRMNPLVPTDRTPPTLQITSRPSATSSTPWVNLAGTAADFNGVEQVVVRNNRDVGATVSEGTTQWRATGLRLHQGVNYLDVIATDINGNAATQTVKVTYNGDAFYDAGLRSGQVVQLIDFPDEVPRGHTVRVRWQILSYVPVRSYLQTMHRDDTNVVWNVRRNGEFMGEKESAWNVGQGVKKAQVYSFECDWTAPDSGEEPVDIFAWFNVAQSDGVRYLLANIPDGVDNRPDPDTAKVFRRTVRPAAVPGSPGFIGAIEGDESPLREKIPLREFDNITDIKKRSGGVITHVNVPDNWKPGARVTCEWKTLAYMDIEGQLAVADFANSAILVETNAARVAAKPTSYNFTHNGTAYSATEYHYRVSFTVPTSWAANPPGEAGAPRVQVFFRHRIRNTSGTRMACNLASGVDAHPYESDGMFGRFIERSVKIEDEP
ncbi:MAG: hypothetical protein GX803_06870 [Lentisphaerae bacterium]|nr:hypothetical protein [Lentisphaerota bacterium]